MAKKKRSKAAGSRKAPNAALSFGRVISAIDEMEARYRSFKPSPRQLKDKERALRLLGTVKKKLDVFCRLSGRSKDLINIRHTLAQPD